MHSDLGTEFVNETLKGVCELLHITKSNTTAYLPQGYAYVERIHKFFIQSIASYAGDDYRNWDEMLPVLVLCYNDSFHSALGTKPASVFMGRELNQLVLKDTEATGEYTELSYTHKLEYILAKTHELVFVKIQDKVGTNAVRSARLAQ